MLTPIKGLMDSIKQSEDSGAPVDTLLLAGGAEVLQQIGPLISYSGLNTQQIKLIGTGGWDYPNAGRNAALAGGWYPAPDPHGWQDFTQRFSRSFGTTPPRLASLSYDAVSLAITLGAYEPGQRYTAANLTRAIRLQRRRRHAALYRRRAARPQPRRTRDTNLRRERHRREPRRRAARWHGAIRLGRTADGKGELDHDRFGPYQSGA